MAEYDLPLKAKRLSDEMWAIMQEVRKLLREARRDEQTAHTLFQDQYHSLEVLGRLNAAAYCQVAKDLQTTLVVRRQGKWDVDTLGEFAQFCDNIQPKFLTVKSYIDRQEKEARRYLVEGPRKSQMEDAG